MRYVIWLWHQTIGIRWNLLARIITGIIRVLSGLLLVWLSRRFIDVTIRSGTDGEVACMVVALLAATLAGVILRQLFYLLTQKALMRQQNAIRLRAFASLFKRPLFVDRLHSGDVSSRLTKDIETAAGISTSFLAQLTVTGTQLVGAFLLMYSMDHRLAILLLVTTPAIIVIAKLFGRRMRQMSLDIRNEESSIQMQVQETMEQQSVLRSLESGLWLTSQLHERQQLLQSSFVRRANFTVIMRTILSSAFGLGYLIAFVWGGMQLRSGAITFGVMTAFLQLVNQMQQPILQILNLLPQCFYATASIDRLEELESGNSQTVEARDTNSQSTIEIRFDNVSFHYTTEGREILSHFCHVFRPGTKTAVMGTTGAGKTTLFRLMLGLIMPTEGSVSVNGRLCFVPQGNTLLSGTIRYNLLVAQPDASEEALWEVLHTACADFVRRLPEGMDTELGEHGIGLSEGQAQRIAIARGLLHGGDILLLDEISSALDEQTEQELFCRLFSAYPQQTVILITHRSEVARQCDDIIRLERLLPKHHEE